jgi:hypothetical protein
MIFRKTTLNATKEDYSIYYRVYGSLAGVDALIKEYLWSGPYPDIESAFREVKALKISHDNDDSFFIKKHNSSSINMVKK